MSYTPQTWENGDIITATKLNNIESGVQSVSNSYTPTTWVNGDIITATKLNNIEQGIANAGGGSSDYSTATVTIISNNKNAELFGFYIDGDDNCTPDFLVTRVDGTLTAVMYKGAMYGGIQTDWQVSVSGSITYDSEYGDIIITGDCTITLS